MSSAIAASLFESVTSWENLWHAYRKAASGKRGLAPAASFEFQVADRLTVLQDELISQTYQPGPYTHFFIHEPKQRKISAAPFRDRVVHHALCNLIEPLFDRRFIPDSYANRVGKGTHRAVDRLQQFARRYHYVLRADIVKHFPSLDHAVLRAELARVVTDGQTLWLMDRILASGAGVLAGEYTMVYFPGDDLLAALRPRGLPIGNLTSQFWANCCLNPFDWFVIRELRCPAYVRYVDDFALFSDCKRELWAWQQAIVERLAALRLTIHEREAQVMPVAQGIPWLGFVVYPDHRLLKRRNAVNFRRRLEYNLDLYEAGQISFAELDASVQGWINHVRYADTWGLRNHTFRTHPIRSPAKSSRADWPIHRHLDPML
ncbi:MAG: group II intron reverse transcriptase domain-containing protein [Anaerolineae bacterium]|nr:group II intron reverse transcriptase domain-containing protein [Anaerolineae bacterium]